MFRRIELIEHMSRRDRLRVVRRLSGVAELSQSLMEQITSVEWKHGLIGPTRHEAVVRAWVDRYPYQFKFVVARPEDVDELEHMLGALQRDIPRHKVLLMPEATSLEKMRDRAAWLGELCKARGYRYAHRLHIELYGNRRGT